ncbi:MAG: glycoside hydrolase family 18 protein, partial [Limisphaerales bacterium]
KEGPLAAGHQAKVKGLRQSFRGRVLLTVGGWERSAGFAKVSETMATRKVLIDRLVGLCRQHRLDGIDYDWEHPKGAAQIAKYAALIRETKQALARRGGMVTVAQAGWLNLGKDVYAAVDRVHLMAYDHPYPQATFAKATADVDRLAGFGCSRKKIVLGIPFYGRDKNGAAKTYAELKGDRAGYAFDDAAAVRRKVEYAKREQLAGVMVWELGQDAAGKDSLLTVIRRAW